MEVTITHLLLWPLKWVVGSTNTVWQVSYGKFHHSAMPHWLGGLTWHAQNAQHGGYGLHFCQHLWQQHWCHFMECYTQNSIIPPSTSNSCSKWLVAELPIGNAMIEVSNNTCLCWNSIEYMQMPICPWVDNAILVATITFDKTTWKIQNYMENTSFGVAKQSVVTPTKPWLVGWTIDRRAERRRQCTFWRCRKRSSVEDRLWSGLISLSIDNQLYWYSYLQVDKGWDPILGPCEANL
jgi:hypothetical protein